MLIGVTEEISAMCGAIDSCCDERVDKLVNDSIGKQILHGPYPDQPEDSGDNSTQCHSEHAKNPLCRKFA
jgi:hypothetical protein